MNTHIDILIDGSGSMGYMKGTDHEDKYLIDRTHTRTDLVKKILLDHLVQRLDFCDSIDINIFQNKLVLDKEGKPTIKDKRYIESSNLVNFYSGIYDKDSIDSSIKNIKIPPAGGTPIRWSLLIKINKSQFNDHHIIVFTDGDGNIESKVDTVWHEVIYKRIQELKKDIKIHIVGIGQNEAAQKKSRQLCENTGGTYINLKAMNYKPSVLDNLLFGLKSTITSQTIKFNLNDQGVVSDIQQKQPIEKEDEEKKAESISTNNKIENDTLESRVDRNTKSLSLISNQLDNIVDLLNSQQESKEEDIEIIENDILNQKIGRRAEEFLYNELLKNNWEKVIWLNETEEQFLPYDFEIYHKGQKYYYECKGSVTADLNEFLLTKGEWLFYLQNKENYRLCFVSDINTTPSYVRFKDLIQDMEGGKLIPCSSKNRKVKAGRIVFQIA